jgi:ribosome-binding protein aMBF1 (putative translation factor)
MSKQARSPIGRSTAEASRRRAGRSEEYRVEQARLAPYEQLARQLIRLRMETGLSQSQLADMVGTSHSAISRLESGQHAPTVETLRKLGTAFGKPLVIGFDHDEEAAAERELVVFA